MGTVEERFGLVEVEDLLERARDMHQVTGAVVSAVYDKWKQASSEAVKKLSDEELLADPELLKWLARAPGTAAYKRMCKLTAGPWEGVAASSEYAGNDGREEYYHLPMASLMLRRNQDTVAEAAAIRRWTELFALGREEEMVFGISTADAHYSGVPYLRWNSVTDEARVTFRRYSHETEKFAGTLDEALAYCSKHYWSERDDDDSIPSDPDDGY